MALSAARKTIAEEKQQHQVFPPSRSLSAVLASGLVYLYERSVSYKLGFHGRQLHLPGGRHYCRLKQPMGVNLLALELQFNSNAISPPRLCPTRGRHPMRDWLNERDKEPGVEGGVGGGGVFTRSCTCIVSWECEAQTKREETKGRRGGGWEKKEEEESIWRKDRKKSSG